MGSEAQRFRVQRFRFQRFRVQRFKGSEVQSSKVQRSGLKKNHAIRIKGTVSSSGYKSASFNGV
jgi:hypothetical protein